MTLNYSANSAQNKVMLGGNSLYMSPLFWDVRPLILGLIILENTAWFQSRALTCYVHLEHWQSD